MKVKTETAKGAGTDTGDVAVPSREVAPGRFVVRHRPGRGKEWNVVGTADTHAGALDLVNRPGDWWVSEAPTTASA